MRPEDLDHHSGAEREEPEVCLWRGLRQRLQCAVAQAGKNGKVFVNGETFTVEHFQFLIDNFAKPVPASQRKAA